MLAWGDYYPFGPIEKRTYVIAALYLIWLLKFLLLDLDSPNPFSLKDNATLKRLSALQNRFKGALQFLRKTTISRHGRSIHLYQLPWYLLIGPPNAGKTSLLANSKVHFILHRQFQPNQLQQLPTSDNCDWWVTRDVSIVDVPGSYLMPAPINPASAAVPSNPALWRYFLKLVKKKRGKAGINGVIIAMPLPEMMRHSDPKKYQAHLKSIFTRLSELQKQFPGPIPCYLTITKCDMLTGFGEFFAETTQDEIGQAWGVALNSPKPGEKLTDVFVDRFNTLIKKINQQLIWRLHQERNPMARPFIKDFPLQIERLKEFSLDFVKKLASHRFNLKLQGVYLTSALQPASEMDNNSVIDSNESTSRELQLFKAPVSASRAFFIKQFLSHGLAANLEDHSQPTSYHPWRRRMAYAASITAISVAAVMFGKDFEQGVRQAYSIQNMLSDYHLAMQQTHDPDIQLQKTLLLLNSLQKTSKNPGYKLDILHLLTFYSHKSQQKSSEVYRHALQTILLPETRNYLGEYLKNPVNKNADNLYSALKAYLMLGDATHFQADFIVNTILSILPKSMALQETTALSSHLRLALSSSWTPMRLNTALVEDTRHYLSSLPSFQLGYIILKNFNNNNIEKEINLGTKSSASPTFSSQDILSQIPVMFTAPAFSNILNQEIITAAQEATAGNWVLGNEAGMNTTPELTTTLIEQLRTTYINNYIDIWESLLANIHLTKPSTLAETDQLTVSLMASNSPLLQLLRTLHENTYFEPITTSSPRLQSLGILVDKNNQSNNMLYQIFSGLQGLHQYLNTVLSAENQKKAAFAAVSTRMQARETPDAITQLRLIADKSPEPVKIWLNHLTNDAWRYLLKDASRYIDTSWKKDVGQFYQTDIANRYPFSSQATSEVELTKFTEFFGKPGIVLNFYSHYLVPFIDTASPTWQWKSVDGMHLPLNNDTLKQIQTAMNIHRMFFPNGDNKLFVQFALQPYYFSKHYKQIQLSINDKLIVDKDAESPSPHLVTWPSNGDSRLTSLQLTIGDKIVSNRDFPGDWGWFKLVSQSFVSRMSKKSILINFSETNYPVKYLLFTEGKHNPFIATNLQQFMLPQELTENKG